MTDLTSTDRVEAEWQPIPTDLTAKVARLIGRASRLIRHRFPTIDARVTAGELDAELVADVATSMVVRVLRNPDGLREVAIDDVRAVRDTTLSSGQIVILPEEEDLLSPSDTSVSEGTIVPSWPVDRVTPTYYWWRDPC